MLQTCYKPPGGLFVCRFLRIPNHAPNYVQQDVQYIITSEVASPNLLFRENKRLKTTWVEPEPENATAIFV